MRGSFLAVLMSGLSGFGAAAQGPEPVRDFSGHRVVRAKVTKPAELMRVGAIAESIWSHSVRLGEIDVQLSVQGAAALEQLGIESRVLIPDVGTLIAAERTQIENARRQRVGWFTTYHTLDEINTYTTDLATAFPVLASRTTIGNSLQGRALSVIRISAPDEPGNPRATRPKILFNGGQHAREWISPATMVFLADRLVHGYAGDARIRAILERVEFLIVPVVNPDGYVYTWSTNRLWRKNRRNNADGTFGVDLNRNWSRGWGGNDGSSPTPSSETYRGTAPFSEPETTVLRNYMMSEPLIAASIDFHSYSQLILSPLGYTVQLPPDAAMFDTLNAQMAAAVQGVHGMTYVAGPTATTIYIASGTASDWSYEELGAIGYGVELRDTGQNGFVLPADQIIPTGEENLALALTFAEFAGLPLRMTARVPASIVSGIPTGFDVHVDDGAGMLAGTPALHWRLSGQPAFTTNPMTLVSGRDFIATIPAQLCGRVVEFYISANTTSGEVMTLPGGAPGALYSAGVVGEVTTYADGCEVATGWSSAAPGDNATTGIWSVSAPQATAAQPGADHSPSGTNCWITDGRAGTSVGTFDVDGGTTTLTSPRFSALGAGDAIVSYWRWYSNDRGSNPGTNTMLVQISANDGATWAELETVSQNANAWVFREYRVSDIVTPSANMRVRFIARDLTGSIVEAGVDDVQCVVRGCPPDPADFNGDGSVDFFDYDDFVLCFEEITCPPERTADFNNDGSVDFFDYDDFVRAFEGG